MTMLGSFDFDEDEPNAQATTTFRRVKSDTSTDNAIICATAYIGNEHEDNDIDFTKQDLTYICRQVFTPRNA